MTTEILLNNESTFVYWKIHEKNNRKKYDAIRNVYITLFIMTDEIAK